MSKLTAIRLSVLAAAVAISASAVAVTEQDNLVLSEGDNSQGVEQTVAKSSPFDRDMIKTDDSVDVAGCWWFNGMWWCS